MGSRRYKSSRLKSRVLLFLCIVGVALSFFMPWVTCNHGVKTVSVSKKGFHFSETLIFVSAKHIFLNSVKKDSSFVSYEGYRLPSVMYGARRNLVSGTVIKFSKFKNVHIYSVLLYLYPVLQIIFLWLLGRYKRRLWLRYLVLAGCCAVVWGQLFYAGFYNASSIPFFVFLDYGFWTGLFFYVFFTVLIYKKYKW